MLDEHAAEAFAAYLKALSSHLPGEAWKKSIKNFTPNGQSPRQHSEAGTKY
jgi:hypothetical protein